VGVIRGALAARERRALRAAADAKLRGGADDHASPLRWRADELVSPRHRRSLARFLRGVVGELDGRALPSAVPLNRRGARPHVDLVQQLATRIGDLERPVAARGVVLVDDLVTDSFRSPLYVRARADELPIALERCLDALEPR
jgi:hypothetical protein